MISSEAGALGLSKAQADQLVSKVNEYTNSGTSGVQHNKLAKDLEQFPALKLTADKFCEVRAAIPNKVFSVYSEREVASNAVLRIHGALMNELLAGGYNAAAEDERLKLLELGRQVDVQFWVNIPKSAAPASNEL